MTPTLRKSSNILWTKTSKFNIEVCSKHGKYTTPRNRLFRSRQYIITIQPTLEYLQEQNQKHGYFVDLELISAEPPCHPAQNGEGIITSFTETYNPLLWTICIDWKKLTGKWLGEYFFRAKIFGKSFEEEEDHKFILLSTLDSEPLKIYSTPARQKEKSSSLLLYSPDESDDNSSSCVKQNTAAAVAPKIETTLLYCSPEIIFYTDINSKPNNNKNSASEEDFLFCDEKLLSPAASSRTTIINSCPEPENIFDTEMENIEKSSVFKLL